MQFIKIKKFEPANFKKAIIIILPMLILAYFTLFHSPTHTIAKEYVENSEYLKYRFGQEYEYSLSGFHSSNGYGKIDIKIENNQNETILTVFTRKQNEEWVLVEVIENKDTEHELRLYPAE